MAGNSALVVGIDAYSRGPLTTCVNDAEKIAELLASNGTEDAEPNYDVYPVVAREQNEPEGSRGQLMDRLYRQVQAARNKNFIFYFSGHGRRTPFGYELVAQDEGGISMDEVITLIEGFPLKQAVIILDCCHSAGMGDRAGLQEEDTGGEMRFKRAIIRENVVVVASARHDQASQGAGAPGDEHSAFTRYLVSGLGGAAANVLGEVHAHPLFEYAASMFGATQQQPVFKGHYAEMEPLRLVKREVSLQILKKLAQLFPKGVVEVEVAQLTVDASIRTLRRYGLLECDSDASLEEVAVAGGKAKLTRQGLLVRELQFAGRLGPNPASSPRRTRSAKHRAHGNGPAAETLRESVFESETRHWKSSSHLALSSILDVERTELARIDEIEFGRSYQALPGRAVDQPRSYGTS